MDAQGPERVKPFALEAEASYPVLVDQDNVLGGLFGFKAIPNVFVVDEQGVVGYKRLSTFTIKKPEIRDELLAALTPRVAPEKGAVPLAPSVPDEAARIFAAGVRQYQAGRVAEAIALWHQARQLDPDNFIVRKQMWAVGNPDKFYPRIDFDWQKERLDRGE